MYNVSGLVDDNEVIFLNYGGFWTQDLISDVVDSIEKEAIENGINISDISNLLTVFIEIVQNIMKYSKSREESSKSEKKYPKGLVLIRKIDDYFIITSSNIVNSNDRDKIETILKSISQLSLDEIGKKFKSFRKSGKNKHLEGGGIGFYDIAKRCEKIEYNFKKINDEKYNFNFEVKCKGRLWKN